MRPGSRSVPVDDFRKSRLQPFVNYVVGTTISADLVVLESVRIRAAFVHMAVPHDLVDIAHPVPAECGAVLAIANASILPIAPVHAATGEPALLVRESRGVVSKARVSRLIRNGENRQSVGNS